MNEYFKIGESIQGCQRKKRPIRFVSISFVFIADLLMKNLRRFTFTFNATKTMCQHLMLRSIFRLFVYTISYIDYLYVSTH